MFDGPHGPVVAHLLQVSNGPQGPVVVHLLQVSDGPHGACTCDVSCFQLCEKNCTAVTVELTNGSFAVLRGKKKTVLSVCILQDIRYFDKKEFLAEDIPSSKVCHGTINFVFYPDS